MTIGGSPDPATRHGRLSENGPRLARHSKALWLNQELKPTRDRYSPSFPPVDMGSEAQRPNAYAAVDQCSPRYLIRLTLATLLMAITVACPCGRRFDLKTELAGRRVACPSCGETLDVPPIREQAYAEFNRDRFLLRQKRLAINEKYSVHDEHDLPILFVERPTYLFRSLLATFGVLVVMIVGTFLTLLAPTLLDERGQAGSPLAITLVTLGILGTLTATFLASVNFFPKRHISFYRGKDRTGRVLEVKQDSKLQLIKATFTVLDTENRPLAKFSKNVFSNILRKCWRCTSPEGQPICCAFEDSIILALLRRFLGTMFGLLRTNFVIVGGSNPGGEVLGELNRKFTLFDRYVLDLTPDTTRSLDRRVAVALGVILDTGERR